MIWSPWAFLATSFLSALSIGHGWSKDLKIVFALLMIANYILIHCLLAKKNESLQNRILSALGPAVEKEDVFRCPLVPLLPCLGIFANFILCTVGVEKAQWIIFFVFELLGVLFYFFYGYGNSKMPERLIQHKARKYRLSSITSIN